MNRPRPVVVGTLLCLALASPSGRAANASVNANGSAVMLASTPATRAAAVSGPIIHIGPISQNFGIVNVGYLEARDYGLTNAGDEDLVISSLTSTDSQFRSGSTLPLTIPPGETRPLTIEYSPTVVSLVNASVTIESNAVNSPINILYANGRSNITDLWIGSFFDHDLLRYDWPSGQFLHPTAFIQGGGGFDFGSDGLLYVCDGQTHQVLRFSPTTGALMGVFAQGQEIGGGLAFGPDGNLFISRSFDILRYHGSTGAFLNTFVPEGSGGLVQVGGMEFGPDGNLYIIDSVNQNILRFHGSTGAFLGVFVPRDYDLAGYLLTIEFGLDGNLYTGRALVRGGFDVYRYDGATGAFMDVFASDRSYGQYGAYVFDLEFGPEGDLYALVQGLEGGSPASILRFSGETGASLGTFLSEGGLQFTGPMAFSPARSQPIHANVDLDPRTLNLGKPAKWVTAYIELPGHDLLTVDLPTVRLAGLVPAEQKSARLADHDRDGVPDLAVKFSRAALEAYLTPGNIRLAINGRLVSGENFVGTAEIRVIEAGHGPPSASVIPNPLNPNGVLRFVTARTGRAHVAIYDIQGRAVRTLMDEPLLAVGRHEVVLDGRNASGGTLASGVYLYRVVTAEGVATGRFTLLK
jgi:HYDIN/CFA65/VesB family protein/flagellar hook capping protein FlgD